MSAPLLDVRDLSVAFHQGGETHVVVDEGNELTTGLFDSAMSACNQAGFWL